MSSLLFNIAIPPEDFHIDSSYSNYPNCLSSLLSLHQRWYRQSQIFVLSRHQSKWPSHQSSTTTVLPQVTRIPSRKKKEAEPHCLLHHLIQSFSKLLHRSSAQPALAAPDSLDKHPPGLGLTLHLYHSRPAPPALLSQQQLRHLKRRRLALHLFRRPHLHLHLLRCLQSHRC